MAVRESLGGESETAGGQAPVAIWIDGVEYVLQERRQTAANLLRLAGLDPIDHDLARVVGQGQVQHPFHDSDEIQLTPGARFVSIFTGPTPVV